MSSIINEKGCLAAGDEWLQNNIALVAGASLGIAFLQVCNYFPFFFAARFVTFAFENVSMFFFSADIRHLLRTKPSR